MILFTTLLIVVLTSLLFVLYKYNWLKYDLKHTKQMMRAIKRYDVKASRKEYIIDTFELAVKNNPLKVFLIYEDVMYTYTDINKRANQVARAATKLGLKRRDTVAIMLFNEPAFIWLFLGLQKIGVTVSYINVFLRSKSLAHCINISGAKVLIIGDDIELDTAIEDIESSIQNLEVVSMSPHMTQQRKSFQMIMDEMKDSKIPKDFRSDIKMSDICQLIFTSGTTGLPKAAVISHDKALRSSVVCSTFNLSSDDVCYETLPLYHSAAGQLALFNVIDNSATMVLRRKFSASAFINDCKKYDVTVIHYIGELCRYLLARQETEDDKDHKIRVAFGNGLRSDIWKVFQARFKIPHIAEFYGATESPVGFINICNKDGSVGRTSPLLKLIFKAEFIKYDYETREPFRDENNRCIKVQPGEIGLLVVPLVLPVKFEGYKGDNKSNSKKIIRDVFKDGDAYYDSGDLFYIDKEYFLYFRDRLGDTFRWKGENVSTSEVSNVLNELEFVQDANVYGVTLPGCEGQVGMAAISLKDGSTMSKDQVKILHRQCSHELPNYARPKFIRVQKQMSLTSTFKQRKIELIDEGYNPQKIDEDLFYYNSKTDEYEEIKPDKFIDIQSGNIQF